MALDQRLPGVYVDIEDRSYTGTTTNVGRSSYVVLLSDRGPHNRVVELNSQQDLFDLFGRPDFEKYGQGHYLANQHLRRSSRCYVCRPAMLTPIGDYTYDDCMSISNSVVTFNADNSQVINGNFSFQNNSNIVTCDSTSSINISVGDWIYLNTDTIDVGRQVIENDSTTLLLDSKYQGQTGIGNAIKFKQIDVETITRFISKAQCDSLRTDVLWWLYSDGAGSLYNNVYIKGVRNIQYERMYTDSDGNSLYPYAFMDIAIYQTNDDNTVTMLEGPWTVSLINRIVGGTIVRDIYTGDELYLPTILNKRSKIIKCVEGKATSNLMTYSKTSTYTLGSLTEDPDVQTRLRVLSMFSEGNVFGLKTLSNGTGLSLSGGSDGNLFLENGNLNFHGNEAYESLVAQAYDGSLESTDGSIEKIVHYIYPWYMFDYVLCGGYNSTVNYAAKTLVDIRGDMLLLSDTGTYKNNADEDIAARQSDVPWNTWNAALYTQYRQIDDTYTGKQFYITPVYHAIDRHLYVDDKYWISEPVANIEKGAIEESIELAYQANPTKMADMIDMELNPTLIEPDGVYFLTQLTTWKKLSIMKRQHVVKFVHYVKKRLPTLLKDLLQTKGTNYIVNKAKQRINGFMLPFVDKGDGDRYASISKYALDIYFDDVKSELRVGLSLYALRAVENIFVNIAVY